MLKLGALAALAALAGGGAYLNIFRYGVTRHTRALPGLQQPLRVVQLTDLHFGPYISEEPVADWVAATLREQPDVIVLTGDFIDARSRRRTAPFLETLRQLSAPLGVWVVWGNHDHISRSRLDLLGRTFGQYGFGILNNRHVRLRDDLLLAGIDDFRLGNPNVDAALAGREPGLPTVLLSHNPDILPDLAAGSVDLVLSGHTHGGQISLPLVGPVVTGSLYGQRFAEGWVDSVVPAYVSRGLGVSGLPLRAFCPPEIAVFDLIPA